MNKRIYKDAPTRGSFYHLQSATLAETDQARAENRNAWRPCFVTLNVDTENRVCAIWSVAQSNGFDSPPYERFLVQMQSFHRLAHNTIKKVCEAPSRGRGTLSKEELKDKFFTIQREYMRLWQMFCNTPLEEGKGWNDDGTAQGETFLKQYAVQFAEQWDKGNKRRQ